MSSKVWCLFSGGKDSAACAHYLADQNDLAGVVALDTGISTPDWLRSVTAYAQKQAWEIEVYKTPVSFDNLVVKYGFPGAGLHSLYMNYLKGRGVRQFRKKHRGEVLASGVRMSESKRRFRNTKEWGKFEGVMIWAPIYDWTTGRVWEYLHSKGYERPPAYQRLCISGDCLCGAFAGPMEREAIRAFYPEVNERLECLEMVTGKQWGWGNSKTGRKRKESPVCSECVIQ